jgi:hypothetical protein
MKMKMLTLVNREAQTSDTAVYRKELPQVGCYSAIDIGFRVTNGATSAINLDPIDLIKRLMLVINGNENRIYLSGQEAFRLHWMRTGRPMPYTFKESASGVQEVWFRMQFGRFIGDTVYGLDLRKYDSVQVMVDYDATVWGAVGATTFATGTCTFSVVAHSFPVDRLPSFRGMMASREFYSGVTAASGDLKIKLPSSNPMVALSVLAIADNVADATHITDIKIGNNSFEKVWVDNKWYNLATQCNKDLDVREERVNLLLSNAATRDMHLSNIKMAFANSKTFVLAAA